MTAEKDVQVARKKGRGGEVIWAMPERKHSFLNEVFPNTVIFGSWKSYLKVHWLADSVTIVASSKRMLNIVHIKEIKAIVLKVGIFVLLLQMVFFWRKKEMQELRPGWAPTYNWPDWGRTKPRCATVERIKPGCRIVGFVYSLGSGCCWRKMRAFVCKNIRFSAHLQNGREPSPIAQRWNKLNQGVYSPGFWVLLKEEKQTNESFKVSC